MRLSEWPRMPFLNDEVKDWIGLELRNLGVEDLAVYATEAGVEGDERRVLVATEVGILDYRYAPFGSSARYRLAMLLYPWQVLRGVELRADTFRLWAMEHRTRWSFKLHYPPFEAATESADLGQALCDLARVCAVMAEPFGVPAGRPGAAGAGVGGAATASTASHAAIEIGPRAVQPEAEPPRPLAGDNGTGDGEAVAEAEPLEARDETPSEADGSQPSEPEPMEAAPVAAEPVEVPAANDSAEAETEVQDASAEESFEEQIGTLEIEGDEEERGS